MFESFFGSEMPLAARFFIAFLVVLALIGVTAWLVRRFGANRLGGGAGRGRQPRLAVIDAAPVDGRRRLLLIRRDNVEHLLMIGGPTDVLVEQNIVRAAAAVPREPGRPGMAEPSMRAAPPLDTAWPLQPVNEPAPVPAPPPRGYRAAATEEPWLPPEPGARPRPTDSLTGMASEFSSRVNAPDFAGRHEPLPPEPMSSQQSDQNLAEMAQQLEAALRRAPAPEHRPPVTDALAVPPVRPPEPPRVATREVKPRNEPRFEPRPEFKPEQRFDAKVEPSFEPKAEAKAEIKPEPKVEPKLEPKLEPKIEAKPETKPAAKTESKPDFKSEFKPEPPKRDFKSEFKPEPPKTETPAGGKSLYDNLEEEMASLLGRPPGKP